ncbi:MAG: methylated-DNA--[protein]-cysteine S-methyltransferase [Thermomicrobiales bacterium]|nr:methylated-DNA--[protein]-cysteine S-methyltransferase [Thermomicrobiales bacterium]
MIGAMLRRAIWESPFGRAYLLAGTDGLLRLEFRREQPDWWVNWAQRWVGRDAEIVDGPVAGADAVVEQSIAELDAYASGDVREFTTPLDPRGTPFQQAVWAAVRAVPYGQTRSYGQIADQIGRPKAVRATGAANGANPLSIYVPCHRIIGADGSLRDYGGGLEIKAALLEMEHAHAPAV